MATAWCKGGQGSGSGWMLSLGILVAPMTNKWAKGKVGAVGQWEVYGRSGQWIQLELSVKVGRPALLPGTFSCVSVLPVIGLVSAIFSGIDLMHAT